MGETKMKTERRKLSFYKICHFWHSFFNHSQTKSTKSDGNFGFSPGLTFKIVRSLTFFQDRYLQNRLQTSAKINSRIQFGGLL